jgi:hypothetical protein
VDERRRDPGEGERIVRKVSDDPPPPAVVAGNTQSRPERRRGNWIFIGLLGALVLSAGLWKLWSRHSRGS